jgi:UDPglucose 6-dehydrogenase
VAVVVEIMERFQLISPLFVSRIVVEKSTVPVTTADQLQKLLYNLCVDKSVNFEVLSNPEFLAEGTAVADLTSPDRVLIGGRNTDSGRKVRIVVLHNF